jgi:hypothetical protein
MFKSKKNKTESSTDKTDKIKPLSEIPKQYYDSKGMLVVDNFVPDDYYKPFAISVR